jgi:predicted dehydrogenase
VAGHFARGLRFVPDARLLAVGSRSLAKAEAFARELAVPRAYGSYEDLVADREIDVVYVATPNHRHKDDCLLALDAGKAVLCEKPFAVDAAEAREVIALARRKRLFCMEAMWMRFLPIMARLRDLLQSNVIGEIRLVNADFGMTKPYEAGNRFFNREMGGGATLTYGVYLISLAFYLLGKPSAVVGRASLGATGVDEQSVTVLGYPNGELAVLTASIRSDLPCEALIVGTRGEIRIHSPLYRARELSVRTFPGTPPPSSEKRHGFVRFGRNSFLRSVSLRVRDLLKRLATGSDATVFEPFKGNGYNLEATEVTHCLQAGELESRIMPLHETLSIIETIDTIRGQWENQLRPVVQR